MDYPTIYHFLSPSLYAKYFFKLDSQQNHER